MEFSKEQRLAIETTGHNILVSAGAGSGKTAVLSERVCQLLKKGYQIDRFLILTFTELAANEMKGRIKNKIIENPDISDQVNKVEAAHIQTFDAFALYLVKRYCDRLNISPNVNIIDKTIVEAQQKKILNQIFEELYNNEDKEFEKLIRKYCIKDDELIKNIILSISQQANLTSNKYEYLDNYFKKYNLDFLNTCIDEHYKNVLADIIKYREIVSSKFLHLDDANKIVDIFDQLLASKNYDELFTLGANLSFPTSPRNSPDKTLRTKVYNGYKKLFKEDVFGDYEFLKNNFLSEEEHKRTLIRITRELLIRLDQYMFDNECFDFHTIATLALKTLQNPDISKEMQESFDFILVDEYQDTSDIQEDVITLLGNNNIYMVGDIKQSIYRFRHANPSLFLNKFNSYIEIKNSSDLDIIPDNVGVKINLNKSFRSRREVVDTINENFSKLMNKEESVIDYLDGHNFEFGKKDYDGNVCPNQNYSTEVYGYDTTKNGDIKTEAEIVADDIIHKINNGYMVFDGKKLLKATFKDFCIIVDRKTNFKDILEIFNKHNIPLNVVADETISKSDVVIVIKNLINLLRCSLNNDYQSNEFIHAFLSIARSFISDLTDEEIYKIHNNKSYLTTVFMQKIELIKESVRYSSLKTILVNLFDTFDIYGNVIKIGDVKSNTSKLETLVNLTHSMDMLKFTLDDFANYFADIDEFDIDIAFQGNNSGNDAVTLINTHKSKGLEYQICYFVGLAKKFLIRSSSDILCHGDYGIILPIKGSSNSNLLIHLAKNKENSEDLQEKLRLYYVAITRAKEKIIILNPNIYKEIDNLSQCRSLKSFNDYSGLSNLSKDYVFTNEVLKDREIKIKDIDVQIKSLDLTHEKIEHTTYSKKQISINEKSLEFGNRLHFLLEIVDLDTKDLSFINNEKEKSYINNIINHKLFKDVHSSNVRHEFEFIDESGKKGIIDCLIEHDDHIDIIDFKTKNIDDENYKIQLQNYKKYIETITSKPIRLYLLSIVDCKEEEII